MDTIFALATAPGRAGVAIVRISGPTALQACSSLCKDVPSSRGVRRLFDPKDGDMIDEALVLRFDAPRSFTGETVIELHLHGSLVIVSRILEVLSDLDGLRLAEAGEFTRRALENGLLDLTEVDGLADLIDAETKAQHRQAMRVFSGELGSLANCWREDLISAASLLEATIDFVDEDVPVDVLPEVRRLIEQVVIGLKKQIDGRRAAERIKTGLEVAIVGKPNAGKSTLLNYLAGREAALISSVPGTTRDIIEVRMDIAGQAVTLLDTAGVRVSDDIVERLGIERALERAEAADVRIFLCVGQEDPVLEPRAEDIVVSSKIDEMLGPHLGVSGLTGEGIDQLIVALETSVKQLTVGSGLAIRERHAVAMRRALSSLVKVENFITENYPTDLIAEELRYAASEISMIIGRIDVEDLLDEIFSSFCIGK